MGECSDSACACLPGYEANDPENQACTDICHDALGNAPVCSQDNTRCYEGECKCLSGFEGNDPANEACADIDDCSPDPCTHGTCTDGVDSYTCACENGYDGVNCDNDVDECVTAPDICGTGGTCTDTDGSYTCACAAGSTGGGAATPCTAESCDGWGYKQVGDVCYVVGPAVVWDATFEQAQQLCPS